MAANLFQIPLQPRNALLHPAAVDLELRLARAACTDAAGLPGKVRPHAREAREQVLQLRQLDLQAPLAGPRATGEDVEDELRAVEHLAAREHLEVSPLRGREFVVKDQRGHLRLAALAGHLLGLAFADVVGRGGAVEFLDDCIDDLRSGCGRELAEFRERILHVPARHALTLQADQDRLFVRRAPGIRHALAPSAWRARDRDSDMGREPVKSTWGKLNWFRNQVN